MKSFSDSVCGFLEGVGFHCEDESRCLSSCPAHIRLISAHSTRLAKPRKILLSGISARSREDAVRHSMEASGILREIISRDGERPLIICEDRWNAQAETTRARLLAHLEIFYGIYARNCEIRRIEKAEAAGFLSMSHSYGDAACRYRYGMFLKRHTGHRAEEADSCLCNAGDLVAVATFSNARKWLKGDKSIRSYEWTRYASLPYLRISGGMGRMLNAFIKEVKPDDIMTYADLEWSEGKVYEQLGFNLESYKDPVCFTVDSDSWLRKAGPVSGSGTETLHYCNFGSGKYRLKLTEY